MINRMKNVLIIALMIFAIIQTVILWLGDISERNIFYSLPSVKTQSNSIVDHYKLISNTNVSFKTDFIKPVIKEVLTNGILKTADDFKNDNTNICKLVYSFEMPTDVFSKYFDGKVNLKFDSFNTIYFSKHGNKIIATFSNINNSYAYEINDYEIPSLPSNIAYTLNQNNPYAVNGDVLLNSVEHKLDTFFDNPAIISANNVNNIFTFSDDYSVVKYYPENIIEYANYKPLGKIKKGNLESDFNTAINFIKKDLVINNLILKSYEQDENGCFTFNFNFVINNLELLPKNQNAMITITIQNENVVHYKKIAISFTNSDEIIKTNRYIFDGQTVFYS